MKSYTDLEQSKKLEEFLPLESADMFYSDVLIDEKHKYNSHYLETYGFKTFEDTKQKESKHLSFLPCWSLAALLDVLPKLHKLQHSENGYYCSLANYKCVTEAYNNPIDACYEMILELHERKML